MKKIKKKKRTEQCEIVKIEVFLVVINIMIGYVFCFQVYELVKLTELYYAGSHGMDIIGPACHTLSDNHPNCVKSKDQNVSP